MLVTYIKITEDRQELTRQHNLIMDCLGRRGLTPDIMLSYSDIRLLNREALHPGDMLVVAGMAGLGGSLSQIHDNLKSFLNSGITVLSAAEDCEIRPDAAGVLVLKGMALALAVRKSLISVTTSRALAQKKASGVRLGRKRTPLLPNASTAGKKRYATCCPAACPAGKFPPASTSAAQHCIIF